MAYDTLVDGAKLEENLTKVADAIREKSRPMLGWTDDILEFPGNFVMAIDEIPDHYSGESLNSVVGAITLLASDNYNCKSIEVKMKRVDEYGGIFIGELASDDEVKPTQVVAISGTGTYLSGDGTIEGSYEQVLESREQNEGYIIEGGMRLESGYWVLDPAFIVFNEGDCVLLMAGYV